MSGRLRCSTAARPSTNVNSSESAADSPSFTARILASSRKRWSPLRWIGLVTTRRCAAILARTDGLALLFGDDRVTKVWADAGWVRRSPLDSDKFTPAKFLIEAAAVCPLTETPTGVPPRFDLDKFHAAAYERAAA